MSRRTPLPLLIIKLPYEAAKLLLHAIGLITYLPIYIYCLAFSKFLFSEQFETSQLFYVFFCIPRAIISLGAFALSGAELYLIYWQLSKYIYFETQTPLYITMAAILITILFSFRFGYNLMFKKMNCPKLKSVKEHLMLVLYGFVDIISAIWTVGTVVLIFRARELREFEFVANERNYFYFSLYKLILSFYDILSLIASFILVILPWRFSYTRRKIKKIESEEQKLLCIMSQAINAIIDLIFVPLFLIALFNPFLKGRRMINHMTKLCVTSWRRLIFDECLGTLLDIVPFICLLISACTIYQIPYACLLYKNIVTRTYPCSFEGIEDILREKDPDDPEQQQILNTMVYSHNEEQDKKTNSLCFFLLSVCIWDFFILISHVLFLVTIYRYLILNKKLNTFKKHRADEPYHYGKDHTFTYLEFRQFVRDSLHFRDEEEELYVSTYSKYPKMVLYNFSSFLLDIPLLVLSPLLILNPIRLFKVLKRVKAAWVGLEDIIKVNNTSFREYTITSLFFVAIDYFILVLFMISLLAFWRWNYIFPQLVELYKKEVEPNVEFVFERKMFKRKLDAFGYFVLMTFLSLVLDFLFAPIIALFVPFYITCLWRFGLLIRCLKTYKARQFNKHRLTIIEVGWICFIDFINMVPLLITILTVIRIPTMCKMLQFNKKRQGHEENNTSHLEIGLIGNDENANSERRENPEVNLPDEIVQQNLDANLIVEIQQENQPVPVQIPPEPLTKDQIIEKEHKDFKLFYVGRICAILAILDVFSVPFLIFAYINCFIVSDYREKIKNLLIARNDARTLEDYWDVEEKMCFKTYKYGFLSIIDIIVKIVMITIFCCLLWRLPTVFILFQREDLQRATLTPELMSQSKLNIVGYLVLSCFGQLLLDFLYLPFFALLVTLTFWRSFPVLKGIYHYNTETSVFDQINKQRSLVIDQLGKGLMDLYALLKVIILIVTVFRLPFLILMILKNRFPNSWLSRKFFRRGLPNENEQNIETKLSLKRCLSISFKELLRDILYIPFGIIVVILAPWRIVTIFQIMASQVYRIPTQDMGARGLRVFSRREEMAVLLWTVITLDIPTLIKIILSCLTIFGAPGMLRVIVNFFSHFKQFQKGERVFTKEIDVEFTKTVNNFMKVVFSLIILILIQRIFITIKRIVALKKVRKTTRKEKRYDVALKKPEQDGLSLNDMNWNIYSRVSQFLTVQDLSQMSQVNKKFHTLNQKDIYWEYQFKRDWSRYKNWDENITYKQKCINAFVKDKRRKAEIPMTKEERDVRFGTMYVLFNETVNSIRLIPQFILVPFKIIAFIMNSLFGKLKNFSKLLPIRSQHFIDSWRYDIEKMPSSHLYSEVNSFRKMHYPFVSWVLAIFALYICEGAYIISYIFCLFKRILSAGQNDPLALQRHNEDEVLRKVVSTVEDRTQLVEYQPRFLRYPLYLLQFALEIIYVAFIIAGYAALPFLLCYYWDWPWYEALTGPFLLNFVHYLMMTNIAMTVSNIVKLAMPYYQPWKAITEPIQLIAYILQKTWANVAKPLFVILGDFISFVCKGLYSCLGYLCKGIGSIFTAIGKAIQSLGKSIYGGYVGMLEAVARFTLTKGIFGELLLTIFVLAWIFWPVAIPFFLPSKIYFIPCGLISLILVVIGYTKIKKISNEIQDNQQ